MIENAKALDLSDTVDWHVNTFADLPAEVWGDALLCLGTSLPHVESLDGYRAALGAFAGALRPQGLLVIQNRNLPRTMAGGDAERFLPPLARKRDGKDVVFWRFYDIMPPQHLNFHLVVLQETAAKWTHTVLTSRLCVIPAEALADAATEAGFVNMRLMGHLDGRPYDITTSPDLLLVAEKG
jgi:hypothetical protein